MENDKYSYKDFTDVDLSKIDPAEVNDSTIVGSCFAKTIPVDYAGNPFGFLLFPANVKNVILDGCNVDNNRLPAGVTIVDSFGVASTRKRIKIEKDGEPWLQDENGAPVEPLEKAQFVALGISIDPADLPATRRHGETVTQEKERIKNEEEIAALLGGL